MKFRNPFQSAIKRNFMKEAELRLYEKVAKDIENNDINNGVWTKAFAKSNGDVAKQKSIYIELMVELYEDRLRAEEELEVILASAANKDKADHQEQEAQQQARQREAEVKKQKEVQRKQRAKEEEEERIKRNKKWLVDAPKREAQSNSAIKLFVGILVAIFLIALFMNIKDLDNQSSVTSSAKAVSQPEKSNYEYCVDSGSPKDFCEKTYSKDPD
jgi:hypothetical protein